MSNICIHFSRINLKLFFKCDLIVCVCVCVCVCACVCVCVYVSVCVCLVFCCQYYSFSCFRSFALHPYHTNIK